MPESINRGELEVSFRKRFGKQTFSIRMTQSFPYDSEPVLKDLVRCLEGQRLGELLKAYPEHQETLETLQRSLGSFRIMNLKWNSDPTWENPGGAVTFELEA